MPETTKLKVRNGFFVGIDVGGTKIHVLDTISPNLHRFATTDFADMYTLLEVYFAQAGSLPKKVVVAMAGPRNDETGAVKMTNAPWPVFEPRKAEKLFPGTEFDTSHDVAAAASGMVHAPSTDLITLKPGKAYKTGTVMAMTISTGVGASFGIWDHKSKRRIFVPGEAGHIGFQPYTPAEKRHLEHIFTKYDHPSVELAVSGGFGMQHWIEHSPELKDSPELYEAIERAIKADRPIGAVLLEFATEGKGKAKTAAHALLDHMGGLVGNMLADLALAYKATGGIYLTGSVSLGLGEYWAEQTSMVKAFIRTGTPDHSPWLETFFTDLPIYLCIDPHVGAAGALELAKE